MLAKRLLQWLCARQLVWPAADRFPEASLHKVLGLVCLTERTRNLPWRHISLPFLREPKSGNPHIRVDERGVKTEAWFRLLRHRQASRQRIG